MKIVYVIGPYRARTPWLIEQNIRRAEELSLQVATVGYAVICVHTMYRYFQDSLPDSYWLQAAQEIQKKADYVITVAGWQESEGSRAEVELAQELGQPIFYHIGDLTFQSILEFMGISAPVESVPESGTTPSEDRAPLRESDG